MTPRHLLEPARLAGSALLRAQSDARLVDLTRAGNDRAFEAIVTRHKGELLRYCSRILPDGRSEDAVQQVFVNAYRALHRDTTPLSLRSWLFSIAHNVSLNILRQRGGDHEPLEAHPGIDEPAHVTHERRERFREVLAAVAALPPGQRDAIVLRELEGRGHDEIARELGVTGGAARQLISRARDGVRRAAAAVVPMPLLMRLTGDTAPSPTLERVAELTAVGGGVTVGKVIATGAIGATLLGGAVTGPGLVVGDRDHRSLDVAEAAPADPVDPDTAADAPRSESGASARSEGSRGPDDRDEDRSGSDSGPGNGEREGEEEDRDDDDRNSSGPGSEDDEDEPDHSGPGGDDEHDEAEELDNSGPGDGDDEPDESDNSGPGGGDDDEPDESDDSDDSDDSEDSDGDGTEDEGDSSGSGGGDSDEDEILEPDDDNSGSGSDSD